MTDRKRKRTDNNQAGIIAALRRVGSVVMVISSVGRGYTDIIASTWDGRWLPIEIKMPGEKLTDDELAFHQDCDYHGLPVAIAYSAEDALRLTGYIR